MSSTKHPLIFDAHAHFFPDKLFDAIWKWFDNYGWPIQHKMYAEDCVAKLHEIGVSRYIILNYAHKVEMSESLNQWTYQFSKKHPESIPFGTVHPDDLNVADVLKQCFEEYGFHGLKFHTHVTGIRPDDPKLFPIYEALIHHNKVITLHAGNGPSLHGYKEHTGHVSGAKYVRPILERYPELKIIIPHLGADEFDEFFQLMDEFPNLWMDTTMATSGYFPVTVPWDKIEKFSDRILYGSDFPNLPYAADQEMKEIRKNVPNPTQQQKIFSQNLGRLLVL